MIVYYDLVFFVSLSMNALILLFLSLVLGIKTTITKILSAALLGNVLLLDILHPEWIILDSFGLKIIISILMVIISFSPNTLQNFVKVLAFFYLTSFMVGGSALAIFYLTNCVGDFIYNIGLFNSISLPWWILPVSSAVMLIFFKYFWPLLYMVLTKDRMLASVKVVFREKSIQLSSLVDTGNNLYDPLSKAPVIVVELNVIKALFTEQFFKAIERVKECDCIDPDVIIHSDEECSRLRAIPYKSIGKNHGVMMGFKPDFVAVTYKERSIKTSNIVIGIYNRQLAPDSSYQALLNPSILSK